jgi:ADP-heptose:LPS heptosyltransferase
MAAGNPRHVADRERSLFGADAEGLLALGRDLDPGATGARDFAETAEIIRNLDLVISVDTAVAHLAGAMGRPVWLLLAHDPDWRWGYSGETTGWYPSMRLFRQSRPGDWSNVLESVRSSAA